jgi:hypothetical protein
MAQGSADGDVRSRASMALARIVNLPVSGRHEAQRGGQRAVML